MRGVDVSADLVSAVTDAVLEEIAEWQNRPLEPLYALVFFDAIRVKVRDEGVVRNKAVYVALGVRPDIIAMEACCGAHHLGRIFATQGHEVRLMSPEYVRPYVKSQKNDDLDAEAIAEAAMRPTMRFVEVKSQAQSDIQALHRARERLVSERTALSFPEAITAVFPQTQVQTCIVHLIRNSLDFVSYKDRKAVAAALKQIYRAKDAAAGEEELNAFAEGPWGRKYPAIAQSWRRHWSEVIPFYAFPDEVRRIIYTTNAIE